VGVDRVLDGELVQPERLGDAVDLLVRRLVEADPDEPLTAAADLLDGRVVRPPALDPLAVDVHRTVDDVGRHRDPQLLGQRRRRPAAQPVARARADHRADRGQRRHGNLQAWRGTGRCRRRWSTSGALHGTRR